MSKVKKKYIDANAVGSSAIQVENEQWLRFRNGANDDDVPVIKVDINDNTIIGSASGNIDLGANRISSVNTQVGSESFTSAVANVAYVKALCGQWYRNDLLPSNFVGPGQLEQAVFGPLTGDNVIDGFIINITQAFAGPGLASATIDIGHTGDTTAFAAGISLTSLNKISILSSFALLTTENILVTLNISGAAPEDLTAGAFNIYVRRSSLPTAILA